MECCRPIIRECGRRRPVPNGSFPTREPRRVPHAGRVPNPKDLVENALRDEVCARVVTLAAAQQAIAADWLTAMQRLGLRAPGLSARILAGAPAAARRTMSAIA